MNCSILRIIIRIFVNKSPDVRSTIVRLTLWDFPMHDFMILKLVVSMLKLCAVGSQCILINFLI